MTNDNKKIKKFILFIVVSFSNDVTGMQYASYFYILFVKYYLEKIILKLFLICYCSYALYILTKTILKWIISMSKWSIYIYVNIIYIFSKSFKKKNFFHYVDYVCNQLFLAGAVFFSSPAIEPVIPL